MKIYLYCSKNPAFSYCTFFYCTVNLQFLVSQFMTELSSSSHSTPDSKAVLYLPKNKLPTEQTLSFFNSRPTQTPAIPGG